MAVGIHGYVFIVCMCAHVTCMHSSKKTKELLLFNYQSNAGTNQYQINTRVKSITQMSCLGLWKV